MSFEDLKLRFNAELAEAGFEDTTQLAGSLVLSSPSPLIFPMSPNDQMYMASLIDALLTGEEKIIKEDGRISPLAQEVASLLQVAPEELFAEFMSAIPLDAGHVYGAMINPMHKTAGHDQDAGFFAPHLQKFFTPHEWEIIEHIYQMGRTFEETAEAIGISRTTFSARIRNIHLKFKAIADNKLLSGYSNDPAEHFYPADLRPIAAERPVILEDEFLRTAFRASFQPNNSGVQKQLQDTEKRLLSLGRTNDILPYFKTDDPADLLDILRGYLYTPEPPCFKIMNSWEASLERLISEFTSDHYVVLSDIAVCMIQRLKKDVHEVGAYVEHSRDWNEALKIRLAKTINLFGSNLSLPALHLG